jgi:PAS domain S-box-containing protein
MPNIIVVDDDLSIRDMLTGVLRSQGHQVTSAIDGQDGLEMIRKNPPDLIFLDLMMPRMDGYQVLDALKQEDALRSIPVIILTALDHRNQIVEGLEKGANDYIGKPFNIQELLARANVQFRIIELEQQIRQSEAYHRALFERTTDPELVLDEDGSVLRANEAALTLLGADLDDLLDKPLYKFVDPHDRPEFQVALTGAFEGSDMPIFETHLVLQDGKMVPVDTDACLVEIEGERRILLHLRDIHRRKAAETRTAMIFEYIEDGIFITDQNGIVLMASKSAADVTGHSSDEIIGFDISQFHSEEGVERWQLAISHFDKDDAHVYEDQLQKSDGSQLPVEWTMASFAVGSEAYYISVARDLKDRRSAEEKRMEAERLNTLLEIAGGAAHEINQPLTAILGYAEMAMDMMGESEQAYAYQEHIVQASLRINEILKRMQAIREYKTRPYADGHQIVDFESSAQTREGEGRDEP